MRPHWLGVHIAMTIMLVAAVSWDVAADESAPVPVVTTEVITAVLSDGRRIVAAGIDPMHGTVFEKRLDGAFQKVLLAHPVQITPLARDGQIRDRHGRESALIVVQGKPVQLYLLRAGLTRFTGFPSSVDDGLRMAFLAAESEARSGGKGLWGDPWYSVFTPETAPQRDGFAVVEGTPILVAHTRSMVYLNFGDDWRTDFTAGIETSVLKSKIWDGWDVDTLVGRPLRLRGWMRRYNGAFMTLTNPDQIEILSD